jgi:hypothetical protein
MTVTVVILTTTYFFFVEFLLMTKKFLIKKFVSSGGLRKKNCVVGFHIILYLNGKLKDSCINHIMISWICFKK